MPRIAVGGFQHETNTFSPVKASFSDFERATGWPGFCRGDAMLESIAGVHIPISGAIEVFRDAGAEVVPLCWTAATPCSYVTVDAFERIMGMMLEDLADAVRTGLEGVYLDIHGAMVCEHYQDGDGEILRRVREVIGPDLPLAASLDLHANLTEDMVARADILDIFRTYPHIDMGETGARTARHLLKMTGEGARWAKAFRRTDFLIPLTFGCTDIGSPKHLYETCLPNTLAADHNVNALALAMGFPLSDIRDVGPGLVAYGSDQGAADRSADSLVRAVNGEEENFRDQILLPEEAIRKAVNLLDQPGNGPVILADTQDNPGGGGPGDTTGLLRALLQADLKSLPGGAVIGVFNDAESAEAAHRVPPGAEIELDLGGKTFPGDYPVSGRYTVIATGDGLFTGTGPMWGGARYDMGAYARVRRGNIDIVAGSKPEQAGDQSMFRHVGIDPSKAGILALKSSVHFRADFAPLARSILTVAAPGPVYADTAGLMFQHIRPGVRLRPGL